MSAECKQKLKPKGRSEAIEIKEGLPLVRVVGGSKIPTAEEGGREFYSRGKLK